MALTNYLLQSAICSYIFYDYGLGLKGQISLTGTFIMAICIYSVQLISSKVWLTHFRFGPLEWVWRCVTYWKVQAIRR
ncbi:DUF418 domain-containing protein [Bacillus sp. NTK074B]|uniref:DUF418 domain-containing protein n=1 Tax=Bacillus sp. NTK074B TaxID=2802174 RepID=UPI001A8C97FF|nr:DUF418 domain-containing protein [Bacillus sp. NTK074B]